MINSFSKKIIAVVASVLILGLGYYGSFLPLRKSQLFITTLQDASSVHSIADFEKSFSVPLDYPSPIGQEELVRNLGSTILNIVRSSQDKPDVAKGLLDYLGGYYQPIVERGRGMSFEQDLYILGLTNEVVFIQTKEAKYLEAAKNYFLKGLELGPKRPQFLYGMFDIYRAEGDFVNAKAIGDQIIAQWPADERTKAALADLVNQAQKNSPSSAR